MATIAKRPKAKPSANGAHAPAPPPAPPLPDPEFRSLRLDQIEPSTANPRKTFGKAGLDQLAASIRDKGVLEPILVRPIASGTPWVIRDCDGSLFDGIEKGASTGIELFNSVTDEVYDTYPKTQDGLALAYADRARQNSASSSASATRWEIVAGERRWRASAIAGRETIPCLVRELTDRQSLEIAVVENDQREDVAPLEQAEGYQRLIEMGDDAETIALKIGRPAKYVVSRLTLISLIPALKEDLRLGQLPFGHAHLIARLDQASQELLMPEIYQDPSYGHTDTRPTVCPLGDLRIEIRKMVRDLMKAPWRRDDASLVPAAGACTTCPKNSANNRNLFDEVLATEEQTPNRDKAHCMDATCYLGKQNAFIELTIARSKEPIQRATDRSWSRDQELLTARDYEPVTKVEASRLPKEEVARIIVVEGDHIGKVETVRIKPKPEQADFDSAWKQEQEQRKAVAAIHKSAADIALEAAHLRAIEIWDIDIAHSAPILPAMKAIATALALESPESAAMVCDRLSVEAPLSEHIANERIALRVWTILALLAAGQTAASWGNPYRDAKPDDKTGIYAALGVSVEECLKKAKANPGKKPKGKKGKKVLA